MSETEVPTASRSWGALARARGAYSRVAFFIGIALVIYALYIFLQPVIFSLRMSGQSRGFWGALVFTWRNGVLFHPAFFQQAALILATGVALISRDNAWRLGTIGLALSIFAVVQLDLNRRFPEIYPAGKFPTDIHIPAAIALALLLVPRLAETRPRSPSAMSRTVGFLVLFHGLTAILLIGLDPLMWLTLLNRHEPMDRFMVAGDVRIFYVPLAGAVALAAAGVGIGLRRPWGTALAIVTAGIGLYIFEDTRIFGYRRHVGFGAPHLHQIVMLAALLYLAFTLRRKIVSATAPRAETPIPPGDPLVTVPAGPGWAEVLRPILMSDGHVAPKRLGVLLPIALLAGIIPVWGTVVTVVPRLLAFEDRELLAFHVRMLLGGVGIGLVEPTVRLIGRRILGIRAARAEDRIKPPAPQRPILYLRSFGLDEAYNRPPTLREMFLAPRGTDSAEQIMARELGKVGPVIAIGRPGETIPPVGAARFYSTDESWRDKVANAAAAADLVIWTTGFGAGLVWEIDYLQRRVPLERLVIWAHPHLLRVRRSKRESEWRRFVGAFAGKFRAALPATLGRARFFRLGDDGALVPIPTPHWSLRILLLAPWRSLESMRQSAAARTVARLRTAGTIGGN